MTIGHRLYRRIHQTVVSQAVPRVSASTRFEERVVCGFYPGRHPAPVRSGFPPYIYIGLDYDLLRTTVSEGTIITEQNAGWPLFESVYSYICGLFNLPVTVAAIDAVPAVIKTGGLSGWTASALSRSAFYGSGKVTFRVPRNKQMQVGLQQGDPLDVTRNPFIGLWFHGDGLVSDVQRNTVNHRALTDYIAGDSLFSAGLAYSDATLFSIEIPGHRVGVDPVLNFKYDGLTLLTYTIPPGDQTGVWNLGALMFSPDAWVEGVEVTQYVGADLTFPSLAIRAGVGTAKSGARVVFPRLQLSARMATRAALVLPKMKMRGGRNIANAAISLPALTVQAGQLRAVTRPGAGLRLPKPRVEGHSLTGQVGLAALTTKALKLRGGRRLAEAYLVLPAAVMYAADDELNAGALFSQGRATPTFSQFVEVAVLMNSAGAIVSVIGIEYLLDASALSAGASLSIASTIAVFEDIMLTMMSAGSDPDGGVPTQAWAVNLANNATSTFDDYPFNSFGVIGGQAFGVKADGLFVLGGDTDAGKLIRASVSYGKQDFGTKTKKQMARAYVGASSKGTLYLKVFANGIEHIYAARGSSIELAQQRFDVGRGITANYFTFEVFNHDGGDFEIDNVSFFAAEFNRRI